MMKTAKCTASIIIVSNLILIVPIANSEPTDKQLRLQLDSQTGSNIAATAIGLIPDPFGISIAAEVTSLGLDISLRNHAAVLTTPSSKNVFPNSLGPNNTSNVNCVYDIGSADYEADLSSLFFWQYQQPKNKWGLLGNPSVYHPNGEVDVSVSNPTIDAFISTGALPIFSPGIHQFEWLAESKFNYVTDAALPVALMASFSYAESKFARSLQAKNTAKLLSRSAGKVSKQAAEKLAKEAADKAARYVFKLVGLAADLGLLSANIANADDAIAWLDETSIISATRRRTQSITVYDQHVPVFKDALTGITIQQQSIELEAEDFGGLRFGRVQQKLSNMFRLYDRCETGFSASTNTSNSVLLKVNQQTPIQWLTTDIGPFPDDFVADETNQTVGANTAFTRLIQNVTVVDTQSPIMVPPSGFAIESDEPVDLTQQAFPLGRPKVADLADPAPVVNNNFENLTELQKDIRYQIEWTATDASENTSDAAIQTVTVKTPGTNTAPEAFAKSAETISAQMVEIELTGSDTDELPIAGTQNASVDPLEFRIVKYPEKGIFEAELYPYFIEDFRLSPVGDDEEIKRNQIVRTSPLKHLADEFRLLHARDRGPFLKSRICDAKSDSIDADELKNYQTFANKIPVKFVYNPRYVHVNDHGDYFILDHFFDCNVTAFTDTENFPYAGPPMPPIARISKWDRDRVFLTMHELTAIPGRSYPAGTMAENVWPADEFSYDKSGRIWFKLAEWYDHIEDNSRVISFNSDLTDLTSHGISNYVLFAFESTLRSIATDSKNKLLYEFHSFGARVAPYGKDYQIEPIPDLFDQNDPRICEIFDCRIKGFDFEVDSDGFLYAIDFDLSRIVKYQPAYQDESGIWIIGAELGWLGKCIGNKTNENNVPYNNCDVELQRSKGYACSNETCIGEDDGYTGPFKWHNQGNNPGQFSTPRSIKIDPKDVLYVADTGNTRVQRFGQQGTYAGQARSTGSGINQGEERGFILGNMGVPYQISVNSSAFYVMSSSSTNDDNFVHSFKTTPFSEVTDSSVKIKYIADSDAFDVEDLFTYVVDDGIAVSGPASVSVNISRNFRAPEELRSQCYTTDSLTTEIPCHLPEDTSIIIRLSAEDKDGFVSAGGLDTLTFSILQQPSKGLLETIETQSNAIILRYQPETDINGLDGFSFTVADQTLPSEETQSVALTILPVPDQVVLNESDPVTVARGFAMSLTSEFNDIDGDEAPQLMEIDWDDGSASAYPDWQNSGRQDANNKAISPQINAIVGKGVIVAGHTFNAVGDFNVRLAMQSIDPSLGDSKLPLSTANIAVNVIESTMLKTVQRLPNETVMPDVPFAIEIEVSNLKPNGWQGLRALTTLAKIDLPEGLTLTEVDTRCILTAQTLECALGDLNVEQSKALAFKGAIALEQARNEDVFELIVSTSTISASTQNDDYTTMTIIIADKDADGTIDADDAFPENALYQLDTDKDGLADSWEQTYGFDEQVADDVTTDIDGDGFTLLQEFQNASSPWRGERHGVIVDDSISNDELRSDDSFGQIVRSADINNDGFEDVIIGAPKHGSKGAVFISLGNTQLGLTDLIKILPNQEQTNFDQLVDFGKAITTGDFDDNGYIDIAIGSSMSVAIYYNNGEILNYPDVELTQNPAFLQSADLDGDNIADLIITQTPTNTSGMVEVFLSSEGLPEDVQPLEYQVSNERFGQSIAIADIDGDNQSDLIVGSAFSGNGRVYAFLAGDNNWGESRFLIPSFILDGPNGSRRFGFSIASGADTFGDGIDDLVVGAYGNGAGKVFVYDSQDQYWTVDNLGDISVIAPKQTLVGEQPNQDPALFAGDQFGVSVSLGHLDTDLYADLVVGANRTTISDFGKVRFFKGSPLGFFASSSEFDGKGANDHYAYNVHIAGDINGDGFNDSVLGAPEFAQSSAEENNSGYVQVLLHSFLPIDENDDSDNDDVAIGLDNCPDQSNTNQLNSDDDQMGDACDSDDDNDGVEDGADAFPLDASESVDTDSDGIGNNADTDDDNDGIADNVDTNPLVFDEVNEMLYSGQIVILPDVNGDNVQEIGVLQVVVEDNTVVLKVLDGIGQQVLSRIDWSDGYEDTTLSLHVVADLNGDGVSEVGLFGVRDTLNNEGKAQMFVRDLQTGARVSVINWPANWREVRARVLPDMTGDGLAEIGLQGRFKQGNRPQLVIRNGLTNASVGTFGYPNLFEKPQFYAHSDVDGDGVAEIATFGRVSRNNKIQIKIASGVDAQDRLKAYNFPDKWSDVSWHRLDDSNGDGEDDWGLFGINKQDGRPQLIVKNGTDPRGAISIYAWPAQIQAAQFFSIPDMNNDGVDEVAAAGRRSNNGRYQFQVQDGTDRNVVLANHNLNLNLESVSYHVLPDLSGDEQVEIGFMGINPDGEYELVIRHGDISQGGVRTENLGSDWAQAPSISSLGDTDNDGLMNLLIYGQTSSSDALRIDNY